jgi:methionyl-tRNA formyltransferase
MRVIVFASGSPLSIAAAQAVAREHQLVAVVAPRTPGSPWRRFVRRRRSAAARLARQQGARLVEWPAGADLLRRLGPDLLVIASFPHIVPPDALAAATRGALNVHMSLLPRHRGPDPIFWTYWHDDAEAGVCVHWVEDAVDAGDVLLRQAVPLARGRPSRELYFDLAERGAALLVESLRALGSGRDIRRSQDEAVATYEPGADLARAIVPHADWPAERVWHVLSGLGDQRSGLVAGSDGARLAHGRATRFRLEPSRPGDIEASPESFRLHCQDGVVELARLPAGKA